MSIFDKLKGLVSQNADKAEGIIDKAGDMIDEKTDGKYADKVDKVQDMAKDAIDKIDGDEEPKAAKEAK